MSRLSLECENNEHSRCDGIAWYFNEGDHVPCYCECRHTEFQQFKQREAKRTRSRHALGLEALT